MTAAAPTLADPPPGDGSAEDATQALSDPGVLPDPTPRTKLAAPVAASAVEVFVDPVCPFCWVTTRWIEEAARHSDLAVRYRLVSLYVLNEPGGWEGKPQQYPAAHHRGLELLRVLAAARAAHGEDVLPGLYRAMGDVVWEGEPPAEATWEAVLDQQVDETTDVAAILSRAGLPEDADLDALAAAAEDESWDEEIRGETAEAMDRVGGDAGTPILTFDPPDGPSFFGPVISTVPRGPESAELMDAVVLLARWGGFAELKRSLRTMPDTRRLSRLRGQETKAG